MTEVMVNGPDDVYVEREGRIAKVAGPEHDSRRVGATGQLRFVVTKPGPAQGEQGY